MGTVTEGHARVVACEHKGVCKNGSMVDGKPVASEQTAKLDSKWYGGQSNVGRRGTSLVLR